jgi:hypothetical protein
LLHRDDTGSPKRPRNPQALFVGIWYLSPARHRGALPSDVFPNAKAEQGSNRNQTRAPDARPAMYSYTAPTTELRFEAMPQIMCQFERSRNPTVGNRKFFEVQTSMADKLRFSRKFKLTDLMILEKRNDVSESVRCPVGYFVLQPLPRSRAAQYCKPPARHVCYPVDVRAHDPIKQVCWKISESICKKHPLLLR